jgi:hypothetical protein
VPGQSKAIVKRELIESRILSLRGHKVMIDADLAEIYGVPTKRLNEQVKRNIERFPVDFMFQLNEEEAENLRSQFATSSASHGGRRTRPYAFTEHGAIMAANVLNSPQAVEMSVFVVRAFVKLREMLIAHKDLELKLAALEMKYDTQFKVVFDAIRQLMIAPESKRRKIGFAPKDESWKTKTDPLRPPVIRQNGG